MNLIMITVHVNFICTTKLQLTNRQKTHQPLLSLGQDTLIDKVFYRVSASPNLKCNQLS